MDIIKNSFQYEKLGHEKGFRQMRLVELLPAADILEPVYCSIFHSSLNDSPPYEALSYVWGDPTVTLPVFLQNQTHHVTTNLQSALQNLRHNDSKRVIWVDALCINQQDTLERNQQVMQMREIYERAYQVLIWLGDGDAKPAFKWMEAIIPVFQSPASSTEALEIMQGMIDSPMAGYESMSSYVLSMIFERSWWSRSWIVQEIIYGKVRIHVGQCSADLDGLFEIYTMINFNRNARDVLSSRIKTQYTVVNYGRERSEIEGPIIMGTDKIKLLTALEQSIKIHKVGFGQITLIGQFLDQEKEHRKFGLKHMDLYQVIVSFRRQEASDARDKIYAFLGLVDPEHRIKVDYNLSKQEVYILAAQKLVFHPDFRFLAAVEGVNRKVSYDCGLPTWVPDWTKEQRLIALMMQHQIEKFNAGRGFRRRPQIRKASISNNNLSLYGIYIAVIIETQLSLAYQDEDSEEPIKLFRYDRNADRYGGESLRKTASPEQDRTFKMSPLNTSWGPHLTEVGDIIVVIRHSRLPLVLRPIGKDYLFVGCCWLIDSELKVYEFSLHDVEEKYSDPAKDPGFSRIMFGSVWSEVASEDELEEFQVR